MFQSPGSILFSINNYNINYYNICIGFAILLGTFASLFMAKRYYPEVKTDIFYDFAPFVILGGMLGARAFYIFLAWDYYKNNLQQIFMPWLGGMTIHGAVIGGILTGAILCIIKKESFFKIADVAPWGILVGQIIGRWGNFFNSEAFGLPCDLPFKLYIPLVKRPQEYINYEYFHPTFLYEIIWNTGIFLVLFFILRKVFKDIDGGVFLSYLILYSIGRILIENIRIDTVSYIFAIPTPTFVSLITIIIASLLLIWQTITANKSKTI